MKSLNADEYRIIILIFSIFTPVYICGLYCLYLFIHMIRTKQLVPSYRASEGVALAVVALLALLTSIFHKNFNGSLMSIGLFIGFSLTLFYRMKVDKKIFYLVIKISSIMSVFAAIIGFIQFVSITINNFSGIENILVIQDAPELRVSSVFFNPNYYATIIELVILMAFYKLFIVREKNLSHTFYILVIVINMGMLYLTGCRTAWAGVFAAIPIMFLFRKKYKTGIFLIIFGILSVILVFYTNSFPRMDTILSDSSTRMKIWKAAGNGFLEHPLFGLGPHGYALIYERFNGPPTIHAHSLYFDSFLSLGIVGVASGLVYFKNYFTLYFKSSHKKSYSFIVGVVVAMLVHGVFDITILNLQTGLFFFIIISSIGLSESTASEVET
ncbi:MAG: O-antigen ligase family protein [Mycoplasmatales bacterium]